MSKCHRHLEEYNCQNILCCNISVVISNFISRKRPVEINPLSLQESNGLA